MIKYKAFSAVNGIAFGPVYKLPEASCTAREKGTPEQEGGRLNKAVNAVRTELAQAIEHADSETADVLSVTQMILDDPSFLGAARAAVAEEELSAEDALLFAGERLAKNIMALDSEHLRARSEDVRGVAHRCIRRLSDNCAELTEPSVLVAKEFSPSELASMKKELVLAVVTQRGSNTSHTAILAGNMGVPYVFGREIDIDKLENGTILLVDGDKGEIVSSPDADTLKTAETTIAASKIKTATHTSSRTMICANIAGMDDIPALRESGADGVGLFRSEFLFVGRASAPTEDEQFEAYKAVVEAMGERETVIRTLDIGSDKKADYMALPSEKNPALGMRGLRVSLSRHELFRTQLRALLRAAVYGNERIMFPMVAAPTEIAAATEQIEKAAEELKARGVSYKIPPIGVMIETPAAVMMADKLAEMVSFFSIGTNDLTQYALALDRETDGIDFREIARQESVFIMIEQTIRAAHKKGITVAVCGDMAADGEAVERLVRLGADELSVNCGSIEKTRIKAAKAERAQSSAEEIFAPADGELIPMEEIPDAVFSSGALGRCFGILPETGEMYSPVNGTVESVADTCHAIAFKTAGGKKILVHVGIDTVSLKGRGFEVFVKPGDEVRPGDRVMTFDIEQIKKAGLSPMVITADTK